jgi:cell wall-associated NlpC family hydrolase
MEFKMASFFYNVRKRQTLVEVIQCWLGASYQHGAYNPFFSTDCVHFIKDVYFRTGVIPDMLAFEEYSPDWYLYGEGDLMRQSIERHLDLPNNELAGYSHQDNCDLAQVGDILCFKIRSSVTNHVGIKLQQGLFAHASTQAKIVLVESIVAYQQYLSGAYLLECE